jgi:toxin ParE1/3/4
MELTIFWSHFAQNKLKDIFNYYKIKVSNTVAEKIVNQIVDATINLNFNPKQGQIEELLKEREQEFRYLVIDNYKVIYYINEEKNRIVIANVFDTRQNPVKIIRNT